MSQRLPSLNALKAFEAAGRCLSFTRAASELHVTASAISHQIKMLEEDLGVRMFVRENSRLALTPQGERLLPVLTQLFGQMASAIDAVRVSGKQRPLNVMLRPYFAQKWLIPRLQEFWVAHPDVDLQLVHSIHAPDFTQVDLAIQWTEQPGAEFESILLVNGDLTPVCSPLMLARLTVPATPDQLCEHVLLDEESPRNWDRWLELAGAQCTPRKRISIDDTNVRIGAAADGQGFVLTCLSLLKAELACGELVAPFDLAMPCYSYYLVYPKATLQRREVLDFIDWIVAEARRASSRH